MSNFTDSLLELLLSWVKGVFNDIWNMFSGDANSIFAWLGSHWLSLVCVLLISGVTIDLIMYILRWNPQKVWISKFRRIFPKYTTEELAFNDGYSGGVESLELDSDPLISEYINAAPALEQYEAAIQPPQVTDLPQNLQPPVRRRRSDRHVKRGAHRHVVSIKLPSLEESETPYTNYPSPPVHARDAFFTPVYPSDNQPLWQQGDDHQNAGN